MADGEIIRLREVAVRLTRQLLILVDQQLAAAEQADDQDEPGEGFEQLTVNLGDVREETCPACAGTLLAATVYGLASDGARIVGGWAVCMDCGRSPYTSMELP